MSKPKNPPSVPAEATPLTGESGVADYLRREYAHEQTEEERRKAEREDVTVRGHRLPGSGFSKK